MYKAIKYERKELMGEHQQSRVIYQLCEAVSSSSLTLKSHLFIYLFLKSDIMGKFCFFLLPFCLNMYVQCVLLLIINLTNVFQHLDSV